MENGSSRAADEKESARLPLAESSADQSVCLHAGNSAAERKFGNSLLSFLWKAILWAGCTFALGKSFAGYHLWFVVLSVFLFSVPVALGRIYQGTVSKIRKLAEFASHGRLYRIISGRILRIIFWVAWALVSSFFMLVQFHTYSSLEWIAFFLVAPVFYAVFSTCRHFLAQELKDYLVVSRSLQWAGILTPVVMFVVYVIILTLGGNVPSYDSLQAAIDAQKPAVADMTGSATVREVSQWLAIYVGAKAFALGNLAAHGSMLALLIIASGSLVVFFNACAMLSCFIIPSQEYRRIFGPLTDDPVPPPVKPLRIAAISAVVTFLALFIYVPLFAGLEAWMPSTEPYMELVERVGSELVKKGTIARIQDAKLYAAREAERRYETSLARVEGEADRAFDHMEHNVDSFLDWYYSLPAEYARIAKLLTGKLEDYLKDKLTQYLLQGDPFRGVQAALNSALVDHKSLQEEYSRTVKKIIGENRVSESGRGFHVIQDMSLEEAFNLPVHQDIIDFQKRMLGGAGAGVVAGTITAVITGKIVSKIVGKATLKKAAQVLAKVVASKAAGSAGGAAAGAAAGAAIGSVVPGAGTAVGAIIGGIAGGVITGVTVDKLFLMLEEALSRADFKRELIDSIEAARNEFKSKLKGT